MEIKYVRQEFIDDLEHNFNHYKHLYKKENKTELQKLFDEQSFTTKLTFEKPDLILIGKYDDTDYKNAELLYESLKHLTLVQAADQRLWIYLFHTVFYDFMQYRIGESLETGEFSHTAVLFTGNNNDKIRAKLINYLSRLWWLAYLTQNDGNYDLTKFFASNDFSGKFIPMYSRNFNNNLNLSRGVISGIKEIVDQKLILDTKYKRTRYLFDECNKYFNRLSSRTFLDIYTQEEFKEITINHLVQKFNSVN